MRLGFLPSPGGIACTDGDHAQAVARRVEDAGAESIWTVEHVVIPHDYDSQYPYANSGRMSLEADIEVPDPLEWLAFAAAATRTLRLGTAMLILPEHNPVILAKRLATLDRLSGGRVIAGVGIGWLREEYDAVGVGFAQRGRRADEYLQAMLRLWAGAPASFDGQFVRFTDVHTSPRPLGERVRLLIGGHSAAAARRAGTYADGLYPLGVDVDGLAALRDEMAAAAHNAGRDPAALEITVLAPRTRTELQQLQELGVARVVLGGSSDDLDEMGKRIETYRHEVIGDAV